MDERTFTPEVIKEIDRILKRGDSVELKKQNGKLVLVEIRRQVKITTPITG